MKKSLFAIAALLIVSAPAMAAGNVVAVPEPGAFSLLVMSTIALIVAARYKRRK